MTQMDDEPKHLPATTAPLSSFQLAQLAREVAQNMRGLPVILSGFGLTEADYDAIKTWPFFQNALKAAKIEWESDKSAAQRLQIEAAVGLEDALPTVIVRMQSEKETLPAVVEAAKLLAKMAGIGEGNRQANPGEKFSITINLGEDKKLTFEKDVTPTPPLIEQKEKTNEPS